MELLINGEKRRLTDIRTLGQALAQLNLAADAGGIAVALNDEVVPKTLWNRTSLKSGDRIEVIHAVQGG
ncbi:MAG: sulfur carrier protein ThiS [Candidatus Krumholzibacteria bacterium]|nr:sulfur carrier protein ThiS [Candidatus Krumholzibacteria bacterium]